MNIEEVLGKAEEDLDRLEAIQEEIRTSLLRLEAMVEQTRTSIARRGGGTPGKVVHIESYERSR